MDLGSRASVLFKMLLRMFEHSLYADLFSEYLTQAKNVQQVVVEAPEVDATTTVQRVSEQSWKPRIT